MIEIRKLVWDAWNLAHIARHEVTPEEVEEVCGGGPMVEASYGGRFSVIGPTAWNRMLTVIVAPREERGTYYPITARSADKQERQDWSTYKESQS
jgi:uncharacterized DUF497 family protein